MYRRIYGIVAAALQFYALNVNCWNLEWGLNALDAGYNAVAFPQENKNYTFAISINHQDGTVCIPCAEEYNVFGGAPLISWEIHPYGILNTISPFHFNETAGMWVANGLVPRAGTYFASVGPNFIATQLINSYNSPPARVRIAIDSAFAFQTTSVGNVQFTGSPVLHAYNLISTDSFLLFPNTSAFLFSWNDWDTVQKLSIASSEASACLSSGIQGIIRYDDALTYVQNGYLIHQSSSGSAGKKVIDGCFQNMFINKQSIGFNREDCVNAILLSESATFPLFLLNIKSQSLIELKDKSGKDLISAIPSVVKFFASTGCVLKCDLIILLVQYDSGKYGIVRFSSIERVWSADFTFPTLVPDDPSNQIYPFMLDGLLTYPNYLDASYNLINLVLTDFAFEIRVSNDLFAFGNALLYSPNAGKFWYLLKVFPTEVRALSFATSMNGFFACLTTDGVIFFGEVGSNYIVTAKPFTSTPNSFIVFDDYDDLYLVTAQPDGSVVKQSVDIASYIENYIFHNKVECKFGVNEIMSGLDSLYTRRTNLYMKNGNPKVLFLDDLQSYDLDISVGDPIEGQPLSMAKLSYTLSSPDYISIDSRKTVNYSSLNAQYDFSIKDKGQFFDQHAPGEQLKITSLRLNFGTSSMACSENVIDGIHEEKLDRYRTISDLTLYSGCKPYQQLSFVPDPASLSACSGVPCFYFEEDFMPRFVVEDLVTGDVRNYTDGFILSVIAAGPEPTQLKYFTESQIYLFNPGEGFHSLIWSPAKETRLNARGRFILENDTAVIAWACVKGSPCNSIEPNYEKSAEPEYYLLFQMTTFDATQGETYCNFTTEFLIKLYGMPLSGTDSINALTYSLVGILLLMLAIVLVVDVKEERSRKQIEAKANMNTTNNMSPMSEMDAIFGGGGGAPAGAQYFSYDPPQLLVTSAEDDHPVQQQTSAG